MTPATAESILADVAAMVEDSDPVTGPDYPKIFRNAAVLNGVSVEDVNVVVGRDAAGTMGNG